MSLPKAASLSFKSINIFSFFTFSSHSSILYITLSLSFFFLLAAEVIHVKKKWSAIEKRQQNVKCRKHTGWNILQHVGEAFIWWTIKFSGNFFPLSLCLHSQWLYSMLVLLWIINITSPSDLVRSFMERKKSEHIKANENSRSPQFQFQVDLSLPATNCQTQIKL